MGQVFTLRYISLASTLLTFLNLFSECLNRDFIPLKNHLNLWYKLFLSAPSYIFVGKSDFLDFND